MRRGRARLRRWLFREGSGARERGPRGSSRAVGGAWWFSHPAAAMAGAHNARPKRDFRALILGGLRLSHGIASKLLLEAPPVEVGVLTGDAPVAKREHIYAITRERHAVGCAAHLVLGDDVTVAEVDRLAIEPQVGRLREDCDDRLTDGWASLGWLTPAMHVKDGVVGVQRDDGIGVVSSPSGSVADC